jgi:SynChlorMet cassette protein ScmD
MKTEVKYTANPNIVLRVEFDDWGVLFDPDTGRSKGLSPTGVFIWRKLDGSKTKEEVLKDLNSACDGGIPENAGEDYDKFISQLNELGYLSE